MSIPTPRWLLEIPRMGRVSKAKLFKEHGHTRCARVIFLCEVSEIGAFMELFTVMIWLRTCITPSFTDHIALPTPKRNFCSTIIKLNKRPFHLFAFSHFIRVVSLPFLHNTTQHNTTSPKIERKKKTSLTGWKSDLIKLHFNLVPRGLQRTFEQFSYFLPLKISDWNECHQIKLLNCYCREVKTVQKWKLFFFV